ncbi:uncharacterized protein [Salminus brasiliensis]|uniref:uncharacterized protein n=1 Tax=Salminus brasiliensis TaxID=930266 RepID=UPI003B82F80F
MAWSYTLTVGQQFYILNQARAAPRKTRRKYDFRLLSPNTVTNGNTTFHHKRDLAGSGSPPPALPQTNRLIACGKQCVLSPRPYRWASTLSKAESESSQRAEEMEREETSTHRSLEEERALSGTLETFEGKVRAHSSVAGGRRARLASISRPATAPASTQIGESEAIHPRPETPSCRVVWRTREGERGHPGSPESTSRGTPVLHLYLPCYQLPSTAHETTQDEDLRSEIKPKLDTRSEKQRDNTTDTSQHEVTEAGAQQETMIRRWNEGEESVQTENSPGNEEYVNEGKRGDVFGEDNGQTNTADDNPPQDDTRGEGKHNKKDELTEDKRQHEVTQGDISKSEEDNQHETGEDIRHLDCTEDVKQLDTTKEREPEPSAAEENRLQGCRENNGSDEAADNIKGTTRMEPDSELLPSTSDHKEPIDTQSSAESPPSFIAMPQKEHQQVLEKRAKAPPPKLKSGRAHVTPSCSLGQSSESNSLRRIAHPAPVISFPSPFTHTYSSPLPHTLPSFYGTPFGYSLRTLHTPQPHRAKTRTTSVSLDKRVIKNVKELPQSRETKGSRHVSKMEARRTTGPHPKIMSSEWGAPPCKTKTTKTFVWGPWGPQETKIVCELRTHATRCDGGPV